MIKTRLRQLVLLLGVVFIIMLIVKSWGELGASVSAIDLPVFLLSIIVATAGNVFTCLFFKLSLDKYGINIDYRLNFKLFFFGQIAKYIPGKIWSIVYQSMMVSRSGVTSAIIFANFDLLAVQILNCAFIAVAVLLFNNSGWMSVIVVSTGLLTCVATARSCQIFKLLTYFRRYAKSLSRHLCDCSGQFPKGFAAIYYVIFGITYFGGHFLLLSSAFEMTMDGATTYVAFLALSWIAGVLAVISPAGLGIREFVFILLAQSSSQPADIEVLAAIAVIARVWAVLYEITGVAIAYLYAALAAGYEGRAEIDTE